MKCPVYSRTPLMWTPWGPGEVYCIQWNPSIVDTLGTWWSVPYTVEPLYCGHLGDLVKCTVYSGTPLLWTPWRPGGTPLLWTPWGPGEVYCIQWNPSIVDTLETWWSVPYTVEPLYCGHLGDLVKCTVYSRAPLMWTPWGPGEVSCIQ